MKQPNQERKRFIEKTKELLKQLDKLYLNYNLTGDEKDSSEIKSIENQLDDIKAEFDATFKKEGL